MLFFHFHSHSLVKRRFLMSAKHTHHHKARYIVTSGSEKRRIRLRLGQSQTEIMKMPYLLSIQIDSYAQFLQANVPVDKRLDVGLHAAFKSVFPIESYSGNARLEYVSYAKNRF